MLGDSFSKLSFTDNGRGQDGIGGGDAGSTNQRLEPCEGFDHPPNEQAGDEPAKSHDGNKEEDDGLPVALHISLWQLDTNGEALHDQDNAGEFKSDQVGVAPGE